MKGTMTVASQLGLIVLFAVLLLVFLGGVIDAFTKGSDRLACQGSLIAQSSIKPTGNTVFFAQCPSYDITVEDKKIIVANGDREENFEVIDGGRAKNKYSELKEEFVYQVVSDEMEYCWNLFFEGERDVFSKSWASTAKWWVDKNVCFVCDTLKFDLVEPKEFTNFDKFIQNEYAARDAKERTYYDYFTTTPSTNDKTISTLREESHFTLDFTLDSRQKYLIAFIKEGGANVITNGDYFMTVAPYQHLNQHCTHWVYPANR